MRIKKLTEIEYINERNRVIHRLKARNRAFPKTDPTKLTYWEIRLRELDEQYPEYSHFGKIYLKEGS
jgi:hypothetical protein